MTATAPKLVMLKPAKLLTHPQNMRRFYPAAEVQEMANSILAVGGLLQPMLIIPDTEKNSHKFIVVDGNFRLAGSRSLGDNCPPLKCEIVDQSKADQLLSMVVANKIRYDVDPVSEGLHYKALQAEGLSVRDISKKTGIYEARITNRKILADLPVQIQKLIAEGKLPADPRAAKALLSLASDRAVKIAERLAQNPNIKIKTILAACENLLQKAKSSSSIKITRPAAQLSGALKTDKKKASRIELRLAASKVCQSCNQYEGKLRETAEPAWAMVVHAADKTCTACPLKEMKNICGSCPAVQVLKALIAHD